MGMKRNRWILEITQRDLVTTSTCRVGGGYSVLRSALIDCFYFKAALKLVIRLVLCDTWVLPIVYKVLTRSVSNKCESSKEGGAASKEIVPLTFKKNIGLEIIMGQLGTHIC